MDLRRALHGVLRAVDEVGDEDVAGVRFQCGRHDQQIGNQRQRAALAVLQAHHGCTRRLVGVHAQLRGALVACLVLADRVVGSEERLAVVALLGEAVGQQTVDQLVGMQRGGLAEHLNGRIVEADLVVLDRVAVYADSQLEVLVLDGVGGAGEVLDLALTDPLPHAGDVTEPCVGLGFAGAGHDGRDLFIGGMLPFKRLVKDRVEGGIDASKGLRGDDHNGCTSLLD